MSTAMEPPRPQFLKSRFSGDGASLGSTSSSFLAARKFASLVGTFRRGSSSRDIPTVVVNDTPEKTVVVRSVTPVQTSVKVVPVVDTKNTVRSRTESAPSPMPQLRSSKSRTLLRKITTTFRPSKPSHADSVSPTPNVARDAALRERGLLPPLRPNKDLSAQEKERDLQLAVVPESIKADEPENEELKQVTAASKIKQEWEARNRLGTSEDVEQQNRLHSFKFGRSSQSLSASDTRPASESKDGNDFNPYLTLSGEVNSYDDALLAPLTPVNEELSSGDISSPSDSRSDSDTRPLTIPLPPSPKSHISARSTRSNRGRSPTPKALNLHENSDLTGLLVSDAFTIPLPLSPFLDVTSSPLQTPDNGDQTPKAEELPCSEPSSPPYTTPPASPMSVTSPSIATTTDGSLAPPSRSRSQSTPRLPSLSETESTSIASIMTPSLSIDSVSSQVPSVSVSGPPGSKIKEGSRINTTTSGLKVRPLEYGMNMIPVIVESPVEESFIIPAPPANLDSTKASGEFGEKPPAPNGETQTQRSQAARGTTDPVISHRKSLGLFSRRIDTGGNAPKISVSSSLTNLRRSVVGTLSRPKSSFGLQTGFDASRLPPSPTFPASAGEHDTEEADAKAELVRARAAAARPVPMGTPRRALSPTMHSRGSILLETFDIEDEESRRLSEMAFLG